MIEVTQADREAYLAMNMLPEFDAADVRAGLWDKVTGLQAFARHRIAAHAEGYAAAKAEAVAWLRQNAVKRSDLMKADAIERGEHLERGV